MKRALLISLVLLSLNIDSFPQSGWTRQTPSVIEPFAAVDFVNPDTGYIISVAGNILKTTNGGVNWSIIYNSSNGYLQDIDFVDEYTGYIVGGLGFNVILKTTDGGNYWVNQFVSASNGLYSLDFVDNLTGYAAGEQGLIIKTTNGGVDWNQLTSGSNNHLYSIVSVNYEMAFASGYQGVVLKTLNGGVNWVIQSLPINFLEQIYFVDTNSGFVIGSEGGFFKTTNRGLNWFNKSFNSDYYMTSIYFTSTDTGYVSGVYNFGMGQGLCFIFKTTNGGNNWDTQFTDDSDLVLNDIKFLNNSTGYAVGRSGTILKTTTGGVIGIKKTGDIVPKLYQLYQNYPNPFNPSTKIKFDLPKSSFTKLIVYDALGREITTPVNEELKPGSYEVEFDSSNYPSGVYFCKLSATGGAGDFNDTKKMVLIK